MLSYLKAAIQFAFERRTKFNSPFIFPSIKIPFRYFLDIEKTISKKRLYEEAAGVYREKEVARYIKIYYQLLTASFNQNKSHKYSDFNDFEKILKLTDKELIENYLDEKVRYEYFYPPDMQIHTAWIVARCDYLINFFGKIIKERDLGNEVCYSYTRLKQNRAK